MATHTRDDQPEEEIRPSDRTRFAFVVILGTLAAAGCFGLMVGGLFGLVLGPIIAGVVGSPIFLATALTAWSRFFSRLYTISAILCGTATGFLSSSILAANGAFEPEGILASFLGGAGGTFAGLAFIHNSAAGRRIKQAGNTPGSGSPFGQILLHLGIVALLGGSLYLGVEKFVINQANAERDRTERNSRRSSMLRD